MRDFINGMGTMFTIFTVAGFCSLVYFCNQPTKEEGYYKEQRASLDKLFADTDKDIMKHLSVANIGLDSEMVMERVNNTK